MTTSRAEILEVARKQGWKFPANTRLPNLMFVTRRQRLIVRFDAQDRVVGAALKRPLPFNAGVTNTPIESPRKLNVLRILRGEA